MATYAIGDIHGCFDQLQNLLNLIKFNPQEDTLWFAGDLVNGGPQPVETLKFIKSLGDKCICVLGNHDLVMLGVAANKLSAPKDRPIGIESVLAAPDSSELLDWLSKQPLVHYDAKFNALIVHAGVLPQWDLTQILARAKEVETLLRGPEADSLYDQMYGNQPESWDDNLSSWPRIRFIINCFTRMRFCDQYGKLDLITKGNVNSAPAGYLPWFEVPGRKTKDIKIIFGHWASLMGETGVPNALGIDTGCVWGHRLTALRLDDWQRFSVPGLKL